MALSETSLTWKTVAETLGLDTTNGVTASACCTSSAINKWSRHKPVVNSSNTALTEAQFLGEKTEYGYYYGVHLATANNDYTEIESVGFEYEQPTSNFRLGDFRGYNHVAVCNLVGFIQSLVEGTGITCGVSYTEDADDGSIDYATLVEDKTGVSIEDFYVCALVNQNGTYWVRACNSQSGGAVCTIGNNSAGSWVIPVQDIYGLNRGTGATAVISLFLLQSIAYLTDSSYFGSWQKVSSGELYTCQGFAIPEAVAKTKSVAKADTYSGVITLTSGDTSGTSVSVSISSSTNGSVSILSSVDWTCTYVSTYGFSMSPTSGSASSLARVILLTVTEQLPEASSTVIYFKDSSGVKRAELTVNVVSDIHVST